MKDTFYRLSEEKKLNLINSCIKEFAKNTYDNTSLNSIIAEAKISKGGLFKYIEDKRDLYLYILSLIMKDIIEYQSKNVDMSIRCFFDRLNALLDCGFDYYKNHELEYRVMMNAFYDLASPCHEDVILISKDLIKKYQLYLLEDIDWSQYKENMGNILKILEYIIDGYNLAFIRKLDLNYSVEELEEVMKRDVDLIINTIKTGVKG
ncbi:hypothetical protein AN1V17_09880 [Vallitalea sediminicola]